MFANKFKIEHGYLTPLFFRDRGVAHIGIFVYVEHLRRRAFKARLPIKALGFVTKKPQHCVETICGSFRLMKDGPDGT